MRRVAELRPTIKASLEEFLDRNLHDHERVSVVVDVLRTGRDRPYLARRALPGIDREE